MFQILNFLYKVFPKKTEKYVRKNKDAKLRIIKEISTENYKTWFDSGVVHNFKIHNAEDEKVCDFCKNRTTNIYPKLPRLSEDEIPPWKECTNIKDGCRCYIRPE